jgi:putative ABC transport system substrate-binding protein
MGKRLEILKELLPGAKRIGYLVHKYFWQTTLADDLKLVSQRAGISLIEGALENPIDRQEYTRVFEVLAREHADALIVAEAPENSANRQLILELASKAKLPTMYPWREYVTDGGLIGHVADLAALYRHAAGQVSEVLQGSRIEEIPFYQLSTYNLKINLKTAKELGLTVPPTLLSQADEVVE